MYRQTHTTIITILVAATLYASGCTSYRGCKDSEDRIIARYNQNIIRAEDSNGYAVWKGIKHGFFDIVTLAFCEFWYRNARRSYYSTSFYGYIAADKERSKGTKDLETFLGIKLGAPIPTNSSNCFNIVQQKNSSIFQFSSNRIFSQHPYSYYVHVTPKEGKVWQIVAIAHLGPTVQELETAEAIDRSGPIMSFTSGNIKGGYYSGTTIAYPLNKASRNLMSRKSNIAKTEQQRLHKMMEQKYGKHFHNGIMAFENERYLIVPKVNDFDTSVEIRVVDKVLEKEVIEETSFGNDIL